MAINWRNINRYVFYGFMTLSILGPLSSVILYLGLTEGTIKFFNGSISKTAIFWTRVVASGDVLFAFLAFKAMVGKSNDLVRTVLQGLFLYAVFHFGTFFHSSLFVETQPTYMTVNYLPSIFIYLSAMIIWGYLYPPFVNPEVIPTVNVED